MNIHLKPGLPFAIIVVTIFSILPSVAASAELTVTRFEPDKFTAGAQDEFSACIINGYRDEMRLGIVQVNEQYSQKVLFETVPPDEERCLPVKLDWSIVNGSGRAALRLRVEGLDRYNQVHFDYIDTQVKVVESRWKLLFAASSLAFAFLFVI